MAGATSWVGTSRHFPAHRTHEAARVHDCELVGTPEALAVGPVSRDSRLVEHLRQWTRETRAHMVGFSGPSRTSAPPPNLLVTRLKMVLLPTLGRPTTAMV